VEGDEAAEVFKVVMIANANFAITSMCVSDLQDDRVLCELKTNKKKKQKKKTQEYLMRAGHDSKWII
jgi:hypothetical protein